MATVSEQLAYIISLNADQAIRGFENTGRAADTHLGKAESRLERLGPQMTRFGAGALAAAGIAAKGLFSLAEGAGDLAEVMSKTEVIFDKGTDSIVKASERAAQAAGLSQTAFLEGATTFGTFGKAAGLAGEDLALFSGDMVQLAADLASFNNTSPEQAIEAIGAALRGESEPIRSYGVLLDDATLKQRAMELGIYDGVGALDQQSKVLAAQAEILAQTGDAQGDFERTSEGLANQQRILAAEMQNLKDSIGEGVLPVLNEVVTIAGDAAEGFNKLDPAVKSGVGTFAIYATAAAGVVGSLSLVGGQAIKVRDNLTTLDADGTRSLNNLGKAAKGATIALGALAAIEAVEALYADFNDTAAKTEEAINNVIVTANDANASDADVIERLADQANELESIWGRIGLTNQLNLELDDETFAVENLTDALRTLMDTDPDSFHRSIEALENLRDASETNEIQAHLLNQVIEDTTAEYESQAAAADVLADKQLETAAATEEVADEAENAKDEVEGLTEAFEGLLGVLDESDALLNTKDQFDDVREASEEAATAIAEGAEDSEEKIRDQQAATNDLKRDVIAYGDEIEGLPKEVISEILALIDQGKLDEAELKLDELAKEREAIINVRTVVQNSGTFVEPVQNFPNSRDQRAAGGPVFPGRRFLVGEEGPEVVEFDEPGKIYPNGQAPGVGAVGASVATLDDVVAGLDQLTRTIAEKGLSAPISITSTGRPYLEDVLEARALAGV